tara:strand:+ start:325 stop:510 length:186 start_codon:yes stop_codon:yes gene_type:complete
MSWRQFKEFLGFKRKTPTTIQMKPTRLTSLDRRVAAAREDLFPDDVMCDAKGNPIGKVNDD